MNSDQAKQVDLPDLLSRLGHQPVKIRKGGYQYWYNSPFRSEKDASFVTSYLGGKWIWNDFGDIGGTVIDFVMRYHNYNRVGDALSYLESVFGKIRTTDARQSFLSFKQQAKAPLELEYFDPDLKLLSASKISNSTILSYLTKARCINRSITLLHLKEVKYVNLNMKKEFFAFGIENLSESYEIRSASDQFPFKSAFKKDVSLVRGLKQNSKTVNVFEGMLDFLSLLTMLNHSNLAGDSIIMHSAKLVDRTIKVIGENEYEKINCFLDNDKSGEEATADLQLAFPSKVADNSYLYYPHQDLNEMLKDGKVIEL